MTHRYVIERLGESGKVWLYLGSVYAERLEMVTNTLGNFIRDAAIVCTVEIGPKVRVTDSGGVMM